MALIPVRNEVDYLASNHTKQSLGPQRPLGAQIEDLRLPRERFTPLTRRCPSRFPLPAVQVAISGRTLRQRPIRLCAQATTDQLIEIE
jgi:hypothetical protein